MAEIFRDPMFVFPVEEQDERARNTTTSNATTPGQISMTEVFAGPASPSPRAADASLTSPGLYDVATEERRSSHSTRNDAVISVVSREGDEFHYPVVHGRAGGSLYAPSAANAETSTASNAAARADVASRAHRHASLISAAVGAPHARAGEGEEAETPEEIRESYKQSRATPSSIRRHRHGSLGCSRSPPPTVALRGEPVEDTVRATSSQAASMNSSLATTPRLSMRRSPESSTLRELGSLDGGALDRRHCAVVDGAPVRVEEVGVSTPEMAEYFADGAVEAQRQRSASSANPFSNSSSSVPSRRNFVTPRHSLQMGSAAGPHHPTVESTTASHNNFASHPMMDRLMQLMEEQSRASQQLLQRMDTLESTNKGLVARLSKLETAVAARQAGDEVVARVSAESGSPSVTRTSGSLDSAARPSTRAPSKAVN